MARRNGAGRFVREQGPVFLFVLVTLGGMAFIWTAKLWQLETWFVTSVPILLMGTYFLVSLIASGLRLHNEQAGDDRYYMGFLFTLCSLGVSLYRFGAEASIDDIVRNFGVAISSTIAGIALRIFFNQMRRDPIDIERSVRHELAEMTRRVRTELDTSAREFANYRRVSNQMLSEGFEEIARQAEKNGEMIRQAIDALSKDAIKPIQQAAEKMASVLQAHHDQVARQAAASNEAVDTATRRLEETAGKVNGVVEGLGRTVDNLRHRLDELRSPDQVIQMKLQPMLKTVQKSVDTQVETMGAQLKLSTAQAEKMDSVLTPIAEAAAALKASAELMEKASAASLDSRAAVDRLVERLDRRAEGQPEGQPVATETTQARAEIAAVQPVRGGWEDVVEAPAAPQADEPHGPPVPDAAPGGPSDPPSTEAAPGGSWFPRMTGR